MYYGGKLIHPSYFTMADEEIPLAKVKEFLDESMEKNMSLLEALAEQDRRLDHLPRKTPVK